MNRKLFRAALVRVKEAVQIQGPNAAQRVAARCGVPEVAQWWKFVPSTNNTMPRAWC